MEEETRTKIAENSSRWFPSSEAAAEHEHKGRGLVSNNTHSGVPCLMLCPQGWGAHDKLQFPSQTESEDQRAGAD